MYDEFGNYLGQEIGVDSNESASDESSDNDR